MIMKTNTGYLSAHKTPSLLRRSAPLLRDAGQRGVQALSVLLLCCTCPSSAVLVCVVLYLCVLLYLVVWCCTCLSSAVLIHVVLIPHICQFWYITALLFRPVKSIQKKSRQNSKNRLSLCKKVLPIEKSTSPPVATNISYDSAALAVLVVKCTWLQSLSVFSSPQVFSYTCDVLCISTVSREVKCS